MKTSVCDFRRIDYHIPYWCIKAIGSIYLLFTHVYNLKSVHELLTDWALLRINAYVEKYNCIINCLLTSKIISNSSKFKISTRSIDYNFIWESKAVIRSTTRAQPSLLMSKHSSIVRFAQICFLFQFRINVKTSDLNPNVIGAFKKLIIFHVDFTLIIFIIEKSLRTWGSKHIFNL